MADEPRFRLVVEYAGPGVRGQEEFFATTVEELRPTFVQISANPFLGDEGSSWERYGSPEDYIEIRADLVVKRHIHPMPGPPSPLLPEEEQQRQRDLMSGSVTRPGRRGD